MSRLRDIVFQHGECGWLFDQAERLSKGLFDLKDGRVMIPFFTDHGLTHCQRLEEILNQIIFPSGLDSSDPRIFVPSPEEAMYLLAAVWLHDIGMIYGIFPGETLNGNVRWEDYREEHERRSARFIRTNWHIACDWKESERMQLGEICVYHRRRHSLEKMIPTFTGRTGSPIRVRVLAALLRLADACHVDSSRAPVDMKNLFRSFGMPVRATEHWGLASLVFDVRFDDQANSICVHCYLPEEREYGTATVNFKPVVRRIAQAIERELATVIPYLSAYGNTDFKSVEPKDATLKAIDDPDEFLRKTWPCMLSLTTSASEAACMGAAVLLANLRNASELPRDELRKVLGEVKRLHPHNFLLRQLSSEMDGFLARDVPENATSKQLELATVSEYLEGFLEARKAARSRVARGAHRYIEPDDTLIIYGYSSTIKYLLTEVLKGHRGTVLFVKCHQSGQVLAVDEENDRFTTALRDAQLSYNVIEMASIQQIFSYFQKNQVMAKVLLGARGVFNGHDVLARMGSAMIASVARACQIPVLILADVDKKMPHGAIDEETEKLLTDQARTLISTKRDRDVRTAATSESDCVSVAPIDRLTREMYDHLVGIEEVLSPKK